MNEREEETHKMAAVRYPVEPLTRFTSDLLAAAGLEDHKAETVARLLVTTDMLGRPTHGVALSPLYVEQLEKGLMTARGEPEACGTAVPSWFGTAITFRDFGWCIRRSASPSSASQPMGW